MFLSDRADVFLYYPELTHHGLLLHGLASANMKIVSRQRNLYIFCNISMNLAIFCIMNTKTRLNYVLRCWPHCVYAMLVTAACSVAVIVPLSALARNICGIALEHQRLHVLKL